MLESLLKHQSGAMLPLGAAALVNDHRNVAASMPDGQSADRTQGTAGQFDFAQIHARERRAVRAVDGEKPVSISIMRPEPSFFANLLDLGSAAKSASMAPQLTDLRKVAPARLGDAAKAQALTDLRKNEMATAENILLVGVAKFLAGIQSGLRRLTQG